ncbi:divergent PAP2 family protein [Fusibacter sp. JL216-2]|uniref:divergent PAP2 family protein n=1 Tax=Fusibacter sp. JL216-2 TaxID=3071453 RepID=UPI003D346932
MNYFEGIVNNEVFAAAFLSWFIAQVLKVILTFVSEGRLNVYRMIGSGGMPSSHSSFVMGMSTAVGLAKGWDSSSYAIALVLSLIVMYDASGVRRSVGKQAIILNNIIEDLYHHKPIAQDKLKELVGHTPVEVFAGALLGIVVANFIV